MPTRGGGQGASFTFILLPWTAPEWRRGTSRGKDCQLGVGEVMEGREMKRLQFAEGVVP